MDQFQNDYKFYKIPIDLGCDFFSIKKEYHYLRGRPFMMLRNF